MSGRVANEDGQPVAGCKVQIDFADLLDDNGQETGNLCPQVWQFLPGSIGLRLTDGDGRFLLDKLPDRATFALQSSALSVKRRAWHFTRLPSTASTSLPGESSLGVSTGLCPTKSRRATSKSHSPNSDESSSPSLAMTRRSQSQESAFTISATTSKQGSRPSARPMPRERQHSTYRRVR